jgi:prevent-host-death family protein
MATFANPATNLRSKPRRILRTASIAQAKENFSSLVRSVETERAEVIVQRRGIAVAKIIPFAEPALASGYGWMRDTVKELGDIVGPSGDEWDAHIE